MGFYDLFYGVGWQTLRDAWCRAHPVGLSGLSPREECLPQVLYPLLSASLFSFIIWISSES